MDIIFVLLGLNTMFIFMLKIDWLFNTKTFLRVLLFNLVIFILSYILIDIDYGNPKMVLMLKMPLLSSVIFFLLYTLYRRIYKRNPENTFWTFTKKPIEDVVFSILFWLLGVGLPVFLVL
jgi:hypothetical protein